LLPTSSSTSGFFDNRRDVVAGREVGLCSAWVWRHASHVANVGGRVRYPQAEPNASVVQREDLGPPTRRCRFESGHSLQSLCGVKAACRALNPCGGGSSPPRGTNSLISYSCTSSWRNRQTHGVESPGVRVRLPVRTPSPRGATADAPRSDRGDPGSNPGEATIFPGVAEWLTRPPQKRLNATGLNPVLMWVRIPPPGPSWGGHSRRAEDTALSARRYGFESRCPRQDGPVVQGEDSCLASRG
jgi:hypothetical protein